MVVAQNRGGVLIVDDETIKEAIKDAIKESDKDPSGLKELILILIAMGLMFGIFSGFGKDEPGCWSVKEINGNVVKVNSCTGEIDKLRTYEKKRLKLDEEKAE